MKQSDQPQSREARRRLGALGGLLLLALAAVALAAQGPIPGVKAPEELTCEPGQVKAAQVVAPETRAWTPPVSRQLPGNYHRGMALALLPGRAPLSRWWYQVTLPGGQKGAVPAWEAVTTCLPPEYLTREFPKSAIRPGQPAMVLVEEVGLRAEPTADKPAWFDHTRLGGLHQGAVVRVLGRTQGGWLKVRPTSLADTPQWFVQTHDVWPVAEPGPSQLTSLRVWSDPPGTPHLVLSASRPLPLVTKEMGRTLLVQVFADSLSESVRQAVAAAGGKVGLGVVSVPLYFKQAIAGFDDAWTWQPGQEAGYRLVSRPPPTPPPGGWRQSLQGLVVALDPGHGAGLELPGWKEGGRSKHRGVWYREEKFTLEIGLATRDELTRRGATVFLTREGPNPAMMSLHARSLFARQMGAQVFISHHTNAGPSGAQGVEVYHFTDFSQSLAQSLTRAVAQAQDNPARKAAYASFGVVRQSAMPAVLIEHAFHSNAHEARRLASPGFAQLAAQGVAEGLVNWLEREYPPPGP